MACVSDRLRVVGSSSSTSSSTSSSSSDSKLSVECIVSHCGQLWCGLGSGDLFILTHDDPSAEAEVITHHRSTRITCAVIVDDDTLWTGDADGIVRVTQMSTRQEVGVLREHPDAIACIVTALGSGSEHVWTAGPGGCVVRWSTWPAAAEEVVILMDPHSDEAKMPLTFSGAAIHGDELWLAAGRYIVILPCHNLSGVEPVFLTNDACSSAGTYEVLDHSKSIGANLENDIDATFSKTKTATNTTTAVTASSSSPSLESVAHTLACGAPGEVWSCSFQQNRVVVWDAVARVPRRSFLVDANGICTLLPVHQSEMWCGGSTGDVFIYSLDTHSPVQQLSVHTDAVLAMCALGDNGEVVATGAGSKDGTITLCRTDVVRRSDLALPDGGRGVSIGTRKTTSSSLPPLPFSDAYGFVLSPAVHSSESGTATEVVVTAKVGTTTPVGESESVAGATSAVSHRASTLPRQGSNSSVFASLPQASIGDAAHLAAWDEYMLAHEDSLNLQDGRGYDLVRNGIPSRYRRRVWNTLVERHVAATRKFLGADYYERLLAHKSGKDSDATRQIELDLLRTFPTNLYFQDAESGDVMALRNVLCAFSWHHPTIGYIQGLNVMAATLLLYLPEQDTFWALMALVEGVLGKEHFLSPFATVRADQRTLRDLLRSELPLLAQALAQNEDLSNTLDTVSFRWFFQAFSKCVATECALRVWDSMLLMGRSVLMRYALALLSLHEDALLTAIKESGSRHALYTYLQAEVRSTNIPGELTRRAFEALPEDLDGRAEELRREHATAVRMMAQSE